MSITANPTSAATIAAAAAYGISNTLDGFIIHEENLDDEDLSLPVPDQNGALVGKLSYDEKKTANLTMIGSGTTPTVGATFTYANLLWRCEKVSSAGTYNGLKKFRVAAERYSLYPTAP